MVVVVSSHAVSTGLNCHHITTGSVLLSSTAEDKVHEIKKYNHALRRTNITSYDYVSNYSNKFPQCATTNLEISWLLDICEFSRKLRLRCSCQFTW
jgi:hypothetical protein